MSTDTISENVARGMALLDEQMPGWEHWIDLDTLDIASDCGCVLGQLYSQAVPDGGYSPYEWGLGELSLNVQEDEEVSCGFFAPPKVDDPFQLDWTDLKNEWIRQISARIEARALVLA